MSAILFWLKLLFYGKTVVLVSVTCALQTPISLGICYALICYLRTQTVILWTTKTLTKLGGHQNLTSMLGAYEPPCEKTGLPGFLTRSHTNRAVQSQKMTRGLKFRI